MSGTRLVVFVALLGVAPGLSAQAAPTQTIVYDVPISVEAPVRPQAFVGDDGRTRLSYHLLITNWSQTELSFERMEILDATSGKVIFTLDTLMLRPPQILETPIGQTPVLATLRHLPPGRTALFRAWVPIDSGAVAPARISHRITFTTNPALRIARAQSDTNSAPIITCATLEVDRRPVVVLSPPLRGGPWRAGGAAGPRSYHNGANAIDGRVRLPERFAIDFQKVDSGGSILPNPFPEIINNAMFYSNRLPVYAVADGVIAFVRDNLPENVPTASGFENMPIPLTRESTGGNQIAVRIADSVYALYMHLVPGSLKVKVGDHVKRGQQIAVVGNSGNSKNPHLHFELSDSPEINAGQGLPWVFDSFGLFGHITQTGMPDTKASPQQRTMQMPLYDAVLWFASK